LKLESFEKAVHFGDWTIYRQNKANLEVRVGAIYALERISKDSPQDHIQIMEILCAYIRNNPSPIGAKTYPDVATALEVIGRRSSASIEIERLKDYRLNLAKCFFRGLELSGLNLNRADLRETVWTGCNFNEIRLDDTSLLNAELHECLIQGSSFKTADMSGFKLSQSTLEENIFDRTRLAGAQFLDCRLFKNSFVKADITNSFFDGCNATADDFRNSNFQCVHMKDTLIFKADFQALQIRLLKLEGTSEFKSCNFDGAALRKVDLSIYHGSIGDFDGAFLFNCNGTNTEILGSEDEPDFDCEPDFYSQ
jgi:uncharacterized protein YjbI with pentapeptide repeats